jgi:hypothetical protein
MFKTLDTLFDTVMNNTEKIPVLGKLWSLCKCYSYLQLLVNED